MKAIETIYNGYKFRSRLEARWAVFFDTLGIEYQYEVEGYDLGDNRWYLPDFWLPLIKTWIEIKGTKPNQDELINAQRLQQGSGKDVVILYGNSFEIRQTGIKIFPECRMQCIERRYDYDVFPSFIFRMIMTLAEHKLKSVFDHINRGDSYFHFKTVWDREDSPHTLLLSRQIYTMKIDVFSALDAARQARFEHQ